MIDLGDRKILEDGTVICSNNTILELLYADKPIDNVVAKPSDDIEMHNKSDQYLDTNYGEIISSDTPLYQEINWFDHWLTPEPYNSIDIETEILNRCSNEEEFFRAQKELKLFKDRHMYPVLKHLIYIVDTWRNNKVLWGVGRGSSVSSLVLYLIGINRINPLDFDLDIEEFLK